MDKTVSNFFIVVPLSWGFKAIASNVETHIREFDCSLVQCAKEEQVVHFVLYPQEQRITEDNWKAYSKTITGIFCDWFPYAKTGTPPPYVHYGRSKELMPYKELLPYEVSIAVDPALRSGNLSDLVGNITNCMGRLKDFALSKELLSKPAVNDLTTMVKEFMGRVARGDITPFVPGKQSRHLRH